MGIIIKHSLKNSIFSYLGIALGTIYTLFLIPIVFNVNPEEWGLVQLLANYVILFMPFALLGVPNIIIKFWPEYSEKKEGFIFLLFIITLLGTLLASAILYIFKDFVFFSNTNSSNELLSIYYPYFFIVFAVHILFNFFLYFSWIYYVSSFPVFLRDAFIKFWTFVLIILYWQKLISFDVFFKLYFLGFGLQLLMIYLYLRKKVNFRIKINFSFFKDIKTLKKIGNYGFFSLLTGATAVLVARIDLLMINKFIDLNNVAFYSVALFFITVLQIPVRSLVAIAAPLISEHLNKGEISEIKSIYDKTALNIFFISSFILACILLNINEFMLLLGEKFGQVKYVIIILGLAKMYEILNTLNNNIIIISKHYRYDIVFQVLLLSLTVVTNILLIPKFGINGAAMATGLTIIISATLKGLFVYKKYKLHPYSLSLLKSILIVFICAIATIYIPQVYNIYLTMLLKGIIISLIYLASIFFLNISDEIKSLLLKLLRLNRIK